MEYTGKLKSELLEILIEKDGTIEGLKFERNLLNRTVTILESVLDNKRVGRGTGPRDGSGPGCQDDMDDINFASAELDELLQLMWDEDKKYHAGFKIIK